MLRGYYRHTLDVLDYFEHRMHDLLIIDVTAGEGWELLCPFLGVPVPNRPFPWSHKTDKTPYERTVAYLKQTWPARMLKQLRRSH
jgi:hypothetical protein